MGGTGLALLKEFPVALNCPVCGGSIADQYKSQFRARHMYYSGPGPSKADFCETTYSCGAKIRCYKTTEETELITSCPQATSL